MLTKRSKPIIFFITLVLISTLAAGAWAAAGLPTVTAFLDANIAFIFDGERRTLPPDTTVLVYQNRTYVPTRFVAESLGAKVDWDAPTKTIRFTPGPSAAYQELQKEMEGLEAQQR
jgi:hypothetical protein